MLLVKVMECSARLTCSETATVLAASAAVLKPLIPAKRKGGLDFTLFKDGVFLRLYLLGMFMTFGYLIPYTFMAGEFFLLHFAS